ncbi:MAG: hypothetical protein KDA21_13390 [Phycisphaerales bacterium]|nr:hypothetical protein [Phycisphaerales bacterium]
MLGCRNRCRGWSSLVAAAAVLGWGSPLVVAQNGMARGDAAAAAPSEVPKEVQKILDAAVKAMGGRDTIDEITSMHSKMDMFTDMGTITSEHWWQKPDKSLTKQSIPQMGEMSSGTDGKVWWRNVPMMGYQLISEEEADAMGPGGFLAEIIDIETSMTEQYEGLEALGPADFDGHECLRIKGRNRDREGTAVLFFDASTGLPVGAETEDEGPFGKQTSTMYLRDWKKVDGLTLFHTMTFQAGPQKAEAKVTLVEFNKVPASTFELPDEVKALVSDKPATNDGGGGKTLEDFNDQQRAMIESVLKSTEHVKDPAALRQMITNVSRGLDYMPADQKEAMQFAISKIEERIKALGG